MKRLFRLRTGPAGVDREVDREIRFHLEMRTREFIETGLSTEQAREAAIASFGDIGLIEAECREISTLKERERAMSDVWQALMQDMRFAVRTLAKSPAFTAVMVLTLALGIGANTAIFSVINGVLLRPLPFESGDRMLHLQQPAVAAGVPNVGFSPLEVADYREQSRTLDGVVEYHSMTFTLLGRGEPQRVQTGVVSASFFDALGVQPLLGRTFRPGEDANGAPAVLMLSYEYWQRVFGGDPKVVGQVFSMNDRAHTVVGVLPALPQYPNANDVYMPISDCPFRSGQRWSNTRGARGLTVLARLRPGMSLQQARTDLAGVASRLHAEYPQAYAPSRGLQTTAASLRDELTRNARPTLFVLLGTVGFLLLIVCANVANLTLARLVRRERELALRSALGASRGRLLQQLLTESTILALAGGLVGLFIAFAGLDVLKTFVARFTPRASEIGIDGTVLLFTVAVSLAAGLVLGALPALPARAKVVEALKEGSGASASASRQRLRALLIVSQVAVSFVLLIGAGLMLRSFIKLQQVNPGFDPENVLTARITLNWTKYNDNPKQRAFYQALMPRLEEAPGTIAAAASLTIPLNSDLGRLNTPFQLEGQPVPPGEAGPQSDYRVASPDYFRTVGIPLVRGRAFTALDRDSAPQVAMINQAMAQHYWGADDPIGRRISFDRGEHWTTVVGIVGDVKQYGLDSAAVDEVYLPLDQQPSGELRVLVRSKADPATIARYVRESVRAIDPEQPVTDVQTLAQVRKDALASPRLTALLLSLFASLALLITAAGIAGVMAFTVSQRTREIGIRIALGAERAEVLRMVLRQGMRMVVFGLAIGVAGALALTRLMARLLFGVGVVDPATFVLVALVLAGVAAAACLGPARRATTVDPVNALRST